MDNSIRRPRIPKGRRVPITVSLDVKTHKALRKIGDGNRSRAIEELVRRHLAAKQIPEPVT